MHHPTFLGGGISSRLFGPKIVFSYLDIVRIDQMIKGEKILNTNNFGPLNVKKCVIVIKMLVFLCCLDVFSKVKAVIDHELNNFLFIFWITIKHDKYKQG